MRKRGLEYLQLKHFSASYISQAVLSAAYLGKSPAQASLGEAVRHLPHPINDKRAAQPYADAAYSAIKALLEGVLGRERDKSMLPHRRQAPLPARQRAPPAIPPMLPEAERCPAGPCWSP